MPGPGGDLVVYREALYMVLARVATIVQTVFLFSAVFYFMVPLSATFPDISGPHRGDSVAKQRYRSVELCTYILLRSPQSGRVNFLDPWARRKLFRVPIELHALVCSPEISIFPFYFQKSRP